MPIRKLENTHKSSTFQSLKDKIIGKHKLSRVCQDIDLLKLNNDKIESVIEVKAGKEDNKRWKPYVKKYFPHWADNRLDDINYEALYKFAEQLNVNLLLFRYEKNKLKNGISFFKVIINENTLDFVTYGVFSLAKFIESSTGQVSNMNISRTFTEEKDFHNPNIPLEENLYHFIHTNAKLNSYYYVERDGIWTMLISDEVSLSPLWIYIELNISLNADFYSKPDLFVREFFPAIEMIEKLNIPLSIIAYESDLNYIEVWEYDLQKKDFKFLKRFGIDEEFESYYIQYIAK